jgi:hypothetical protein
VSSDAQAAATPLELVHLRRDARTSLELAIVGLAPQELIDELAAVTGMLEAIDGLPQEAPNVAALMPSLIKRARAVLERWNTWHVGRLGQG